jgi:hypothetical protein
MMWLPGLSGTQRHLLESQPTSSNCWITMLEEVMLFGMLETDDGDNTHLRNVNNAL